MRIRYRIVQERSSELNWETIGVIAHWVSVPAPLHLNGIVQHTVSTAIWRIIGERVDKNQLTLETYHQAFTGFDQYYRLLPEIHELEAESAAEIRRIIREKYVWVAESSAIETETPEIVPETVFA